MVLSKSDFKKLVAFEKQVKKGSKKINFEKFIQLRAKASDTEAELAALIARKKRK